MDMKFGSDGLAMSVPVVETNNSAVFPKSINPFPGKICVSRKKSTVAVRVPVAIEKSRLTVNR